MMATGMLVARPHHTLRVHSLPAVLPALACPLLACCRATAAHPGITLASLRAFPENFAVLILS